MGKTNHLLGLRIENYKPLELVAIEFPPGGGAFAIMGANEAGKTSTLDALETIIAGKKGAALKIAEPIRKGADSSRIVATFEDVIVTRVFKANGSTAITVTARDGSRITNADDVKAALYSHVALDPLAFSRQSEADQVATLLPLIGYDPAADAAAEAKERDARTIVGREVDRLKGVLSGYGDPVHGLPAEEVTVADLSAKLEAAIQQNAERERADVAQTSAVTEINRATDAVALAEQTLANAQRALDDAKARLAETNEKAAATVAAYNALPAAIDTAPLREAIAGAESTNRAIRNNTARMVVAAGLVEAERTYQAHTDEIKAITSRKASALAAAALPVPGMAIDPDAWILTLDGIPFSQASTARRAITGAAIAMALNPDLRLIVIRDASLLDAANREVIDELAKANGYLVLLEIADLNSPVGVVIGDGHVTEVRS